MAGIFCKVRRARKTSRRLCRGLKSRLGRGWRRRSLLLRRCWSKFKGIAAGIAEGITEGIAEETPKGETPSRLAQARYWYRQAADAGTCRERSTTWGRSMRAETGGGVLLPQDYLPSRKALRAVSKRMSSEARVRSRVTISLDAAQHNLGTIYARGEGVALDDEQAFRWFFLAAVQDYLPSRKALRAVSKRMSSEARVRARGLVKDFLEPKIFDAKTREEEEQLGDVRCALRFDW